MTMTHVSFTITQGSRKYVFVNVNTLQTVKAIVPESWFTESPNWIRNRCKQGVHCRVSPNSSSLAQRSVRLKRILVSSIGELVDLDWNEVEFELEALDQNTDVLPHDDFIDFLISKKASRTFSKVFNKKVLDKKTPSVV